MQLPFLLRGSACPLRCRIVSGSAFFMHPSPLPSLGFPSAAMVASEYQLLPRRAGVHSTLTCIKPLEIFPHERQV